MGENFISTLEEKLGTEVTDEMLKKFLAIANENAGESSKVSNEMMIIILKALMKARQKI